MRRVGLVLAMVVLVAGGAVSLRPIPSQGTSTVKGARAEATPSTNVPTGGTGAPLASVTTTTTLQAPTTGVALAPPDGKTSDQRRLSKVTTVTGGLTPKSVVASGTGVYFAQNMMYSHTVRVYDRSATLVKVISDTVRLSDFGFPQYQGEYQGAPVEMAFSPDRTKAYVSNYQMYGMGFTKPGTDDCNGKGNDDSFVYRVDVARLAIDQVIAVGAVPKYVATTPDGRYVLVTNWCTFDLSVIDTAAGKEVKRIPLGRHPRGIVVDRASSKAWVAVMGSHDVAVVDLSNFSVGWIRNVGTNPRHLVLDPAERFLYVTLNGEGKVAKVDLRTGAVVKKVASGSQPRSMAISEDGASLYVVNYESDTVSKLRASDLSVLEVIPVGHHPIGITYDPGNRQVWVSIYSGSLTVLQDE